MAATVAELTPAELREMIHEAVREELAELVADPDDGLELRPEIREQLERQVEEVRRGEYGVPLEDVLQTVHK